MMKIYQGVDLVEISKFRDVFNRNRDFVTDIFTEKEISYCNSKKDPAVHFAARFAVKEASLKALGIGMQNTFIPHAFKDIETVSSSSGKPELNMSGWTDRMRQRRHINQLTVSLSHSAGYAIASVIMIGDEKQEHI